LQKKELEISTQFIQVPEKKITLCVRREDLVHPFVSGNKFRKLKYNLVRAKAEGKTKLLTFGGAFSNHIAAVAAAGKEQGFDTFGIIRGEELAGITEENPTLKFASECGMQLEFVSREAYRNKSEPAFLEQLKLKFGNIYILPEGGTNELAVEGCGEILTEEDADFDYICCAVGTGGTISGIINSANKNQQILGFPALKGDFLEGEISKFTSGQNWKLVTGYHFGGYGKVTETLIRFMNDFYSKNGILLDPVYTGKLFFGVMDLIRNDYFPEDSKILVIHTGGIQGIQGMNIRLKHKNLPLIDTND
jgi:1-aminocyclopropane-1-carboxylate deaminase/D-cysteine desulfhydrase-like pyridoxal-dependent ACC family enzyme